ncbi:hypothetical protein KL909_004587 [Ogataea angusta]|nr:hypothetical protein KL909_004587 [Ogataea angusta]
MRDSIAQNPYRSLAFLLLYAGPAKFAGKSRPQCPCSYTVAAERGLCERQSVPVAIETDWLSRAQLFGLHAFRTDGIDNKIVPLQAHFGQPEASLLGLAWPDSAYATVVGNEYSIGELHSAEYPGKQQTGRLD